MPPTLKHSVPHPHTDILAVPKIDVGFRTNFGLVEGVLLPWL